MKFIRWMGAFRKQDTLETSAAWEITQVDRQVAVEPLWHGKSRMRGAKVGLVVDHAASHFCKGWVEDAFSTEKEHGTLYSTRKLQPIRKMDQFLRIWNSEVRARHGEAIFDHVAYSAVVIRKGVTARGRRRAQRLATDLNLPIKILE